ncbi:MAG: phosphotransferase, partial [Propionibacteriales bacterium]|nr:phosphotransferase [Propionibacteriales bacterium]
LGAVAWRYAVAGVVGKPSPSAATTATPAVLAGVDGEVDGDVRPVLLARGEAPWSRVVLLPFGQTDERPRAVVKVPRRPQHNPATQREHQSLSSVRDRLPPDLAVTVPMALGLRTWSGLSVSTESFLAGRPLAFAGAPVTGRLSSAAQLDGAVDWLIDLHRATRSTDLVAGDAAASEIVDNPLRRVGQLLGLQGQWAETLIERFGIARAGTCSVPTVWQHCDLTPRNMRWDGRHHAVVDWEVARVGPALCDLLYLLLHWSWQGLPSFGDDHAAVFRRVYLSADGDPAAQAGFQVRRYCSAFTMDRRLVAPLLLSMLTQQALDRAHRVQDCGGAPAGDDNVYADLIDQMATGSDRLAAWSRS